MIFPFLSFLITSSTSSFPHHFLLFFLFYDIPFSPFPNPIFYFRSTLFFLFYDIFLFLSFLITSSTSSFPHHIFLFFLFMILPFLPFPSQSSTSSFPHHIFLFFLFYDIFPFFLFQSHLPLLPFVITSSTSCFPHHIFPLLFMISSSLFPFLITAIIPFFLWFYILILVSCDLCTTIELYNTAAVSNLIICYASNNGDWMWDHYLQHELIFFSA
jgi:hypothetical protein